MKNSEDKAGKMPENLQELIVRLETDPAPRDEYEFRGPFAALRRSIEEGDNSPSSELIAEEIAFQIHAHDSQDPSAWGLYFGPLMSGLTSAGEPWDVPSLTMISSEVLGYWHRRASETSHPVMRARYADLLWEMPKKLEGSRPDAVMARVAVDSYLDSVETNRYGHAVTAVDKVQRAIAISLSLRDDARVERARDILLALEDAVAEDESLGLWGFCFDVFVEPPHRRIRLTDAQRDKLVADMEARLARFAAASPDLYHPAGAEAAALRLASYYRRCGQKDDVKRVWGVYGEIVKRMYGVASPAVVTHSLEQLYDQLKTFELHADADALNELLRVVGEEALTEMKEISVEAEIPKEEVEAYFTAMLEGKASEALHRTTLHYVPDRRKLENQLHEIAKKAPISFLMSRVVKDGEGRTVARVGPLNEDLEGQLIRHVSQNLHMAVPWLRELMSRGIEAGLFSDEALLDFLSASPLFPAKRQPILRAGLTAYTQGDSLSAIHILIPQIEQALRQLASLVGAPTYSQRRGGGLHARTMDDLLRDDAILAVLGEDVITYLRVLLTDARGWNLRNIVCHGLASVGMLTLPAADRVTHALLVLALVRTREA